MLALSHDGFCSAVLLLESLRLKLLTPDLLNKNREAAISATLLVLEVAFISLLGVKGKENINPRKSCSEAHFTRGGLPEQAAVTF